MITIVDINECVILRPCDSAHGVCSNLIGSYKCECKDSYKMSANNVCKGYEIAQLYIVYILYIYCIYTRVWVELLFCIYSIIYST